MGKKNWLKRNFIPLLTLLLVIAITVGIFYFYKYHPGTVGQLKRYGYLGVFLISLTFNATLLLPAGNILILSVVGAVLPSAIVVGLGEAISGEIPPAAIVSLAVLATGVLLAIVLAVESWVWKRG